MRKSLLVVFLLSCSVFSFAEGGVEVTKENRGLFGYKTVTEVFGEGRHTLSCFDPGRTRCRTNMGIVVVDETLTLTEAEFVLIDTKVEELVKEDNLTGLFVFDSKCVIVYAYNADTDRLVYTMYSIAEAEDLNLI